MDATLTVERITYALDATFTGLIDMSDVMRESEAKQRSKFLSRALAAFCIHSLTEVDPLQAAASITDSYDDQGIDAIYIDINDKAVYIVQSKWTKVPDQGDVEKFLSGIEALIQANFSRFDEKVRRREAELKSNFLHRSDNRIVIVLAYMNHEPLGDHAERALNDYIARQNNVADEVFSIEKFDLKRTYGRLSGSSNGKINFQIALREWGQVRDPYRSYYGQVLLTDVASWSKYGRALFSKNLRFYRPSTDVNVAIEKTVLQSPGHFWYFNNGITVLCKSVEKTAIGGDARDHAIFDCSGVSIINGAQTVGVVWDIAKRDPAHLSAANAKVSARILSLEGCPEGFGTEITRAANTQNRIQHRDFAALDPEQQRLAREMALDGKRYAYKSGDDPDPKNDEGCNIDEATVALACANGDLVLAVQAKREVGLLWEDISKHPYTTLFNDKLQSRTLWRSVLISREVDEALGELNKDLFARGDMVAVHGNRFILRRVFLDPQVASMWRDPSVETKRILKSAREATSEVMAALADLVQVRQPTAYLATLFKNLQKCKDLDDELSLQGVTKDPQGELPFGVK